MVTEFALCIARCSMFSLRMLLAVVAISAVYIAGMVYRTE